MDYLQTTPRLPAAYYRRHAARVWKLASEATTPAVKDHLREVAGQYERLAESVEGLGRSEDEPLRRSGG